MLLLRFFLCLGFVFCAASAFFFSSRSFLFLSLSNAFAFFSSSLAIFLSSLLIRCSKKLSLVVISTDLPVLIPGFRFLLGAVGSGSFSTSLKALDEELSETWVTKEKLDLASLGWLMASHSSYRESGKS